MEMNSLAQLLYGHNRPVVQPTAQAAPSSQYNAPSQVGASEAYQRYLKTAGANPMSPEQFMQRLQG